MITIDTTEFVTSHGTTPRGRGSWGFALRVTPIEFFWTQGTYTQARLALIAKYGRTSGTWKVLP